MTGQSVYKSHPIYFWEITMGMAFEMGPRSFLWTCQGTYAVGVFSVIPKGRAGEYGAGNRILRQKQHRKAVSCRSEKGTTVFFLLLAGNTGSRFSEFLRLRNRLSDRERLRKVFLRVYFAGFFWESRGKLWYNQNRRCQEKCVEQNFSDTTGALMPACGDRQSRSPVSWNCGFYSVWGNFLRRTVWKLLYSEFLTELCKNFSARSPSGAVLFFMSAAGIASFRRSGDRQLLDTGFV